MIITVDTSENKSLQYIDTWNVIHPKKTEEITWAYQSLDYGDIRGERGQIFEIKIDEDLSSSLKSGHLEEQLRYMYACAEHLPRYLVCIGAITIDEYKWAGSLAQKYNTYITHKSLGTAAIDYIVNICLDERDDPLDLNLPIKRRDIEPSLVAALGYTVKGLSMECAAEIVGWRKTFEDLVEDLSAEKVQKIIFEFYGKEMQALTDKVCKAIWGDING
jgi:hypothetical protein